MRGRLRRNNAVTFFVRQFATQNYFTCLSGPRIMSRTKLDHIKSRVVSGHPKQRKTLWTFFGTTLSEKQRAGIYPASELKVSNESKKASLI